MYVLFNFLIVLLLLVTLYKIKVVTPKKEFNRDYLSVKTCNCYRGFFALIVILHHIAQRVSGGVYFSDFTRAGYLAVAVFFFLSGYGLQKKNLTDSTYSHGFLLKRIPSILIPYLIMCLLYWCAYALLGDVRSIASMWNNFIINGDPIVWFSWYVVCILVFYLVFYLLMKTAKQNRPAMLLGGIIYYAVYVFVCRRLSFGIWWYQTALFPVFGILWASYEEKIVSFIKKTYLFILPAVVIIFYFFGKFKWNIYWLKPSVTLEIALTIVLAFLFIMIVVISSLKLKFTNPILAALGKISFEIYMAQGLFMLIFRNEHIFIKNDFLWALSVIATSVLAAFLLNKLFGYILKKYAKVLEKLRT